MYFGFIFIIIGLFVEVLGLEFLYTFLVWIGMFEGVDMHCLTKLWGVCVEMMLMQSFRNDFAKCVWRGVWKFR